MPTFGIRRWPLGYLSAQDNLCTVRSCLVDSFGAPYSRTTLNFAAQKGDSEERIYIFYADEKSVGVKTMRKWVPWLALPCPRECLDRPSISHRFLGVLDERKIENGILIYNNAMTPSANKVITSMAESFTLEAFQENELLVNITHHMLVPTHEVMTPEEKKALLQK